MSFVWTSYQRAVHPHNIGASLHVELGQAFPHQPGGPQSADGLVHFHSSMRKFLMKQRVNKVVIEGECEKERREEN